MKNAQSQEGSTQTKTKTIQSPYDYGRLLQLLDEHGKKVYSHHFCIDEIDRPVVLKLMAYFLRDEMVAEREGIDLQKGMLLAGRVGCGKTAIMALLRDLAIESQRPQMVSCRAVSFEFGRIGYDIIGRYTNLAFFPYSRTPRVHCFDDLGLEQNICFWGNNYNVMAEILLSRYDLFVSSKMITHVSTNLNSDELEERYGNRLRSRMRAMFNLVAFDPATRDKRR